MSNGLLLKRKFEHNNVAIYDFFEIINNKEVFIDSKSIDDDKKFRKIFKKTSESLKGLIDKNGRYVVQIDDK